MSPIDESSQFDANARILGLPLMKRRATCGLCCAAVPPGYVAPEQERRSMVVLNELQSVGQFVQRELASGFARETVSLQEALRFIDVRFAVKPTGATCHFRAVIELHTGKHSVGQRMARDAFTAIRDSLACGLCKGMRLSVEVRMQPAVTACLPNKPD